MNHTPDPRTPDRGMTDDQLMRLLGEVIDAREPVPQAVLEAAYAASDMASLSEELAALVFDSASAGDLVAMRGTEAEARLLSFVNDHVSIDLELHADGRTIVGQLAPPTGDPLLVETEGGPNVEVPTDEFGRFRLATPGWPIRLRIVGVVVTPWISR